MPQSDRLKEEPLLRVHASISSSLGPTEGAADAAHALFLNSSESPAASYCRVECSHILRFRLGIRLRDMGKALWDRLLLVCRAGTRQIFVKGAPSTQDLNAQAT